MKALAIFYDSLREALDSKIIYATLAISILFLLLMASLSFRLVPAQEQVAEFANLLGLMTKMQRTGEQFSVIDFRQSNPEAEPWNGDYEFAWVVKVPREQPLQKDGPPEEFKKKHREQMADPLTTRTIIQGMGTQFENVEVGPRQEVVLANDAEFEKEYHFPVTTRGTRIKDRRGWVCEPALLFGALSLPVTFLAPSLGRSVEFIVDDVVGTFGSAVTMLLSIIITAYFIPNMLRKGTIDLLIAKPMHRSTLLIYKFLGGLTFMLLNTAVILVGLWVVLGLRTGLWVNGLLICVFVFTFQFAIFYAVSTWTGVMTRSPIVAILASILTWGLLFGIGIGFRQVERLRPAVAADASLASAIGEGGQRPWQMPPWLVTTADVVHFAAPHYKDLDLLITRLLQRDLLDPGSRQLQASDTAIRNVHWGESIGMTLAFIALMLGLACWKFASTDY